MSVPILRRALTPTRNPRSYLLAALMVGLTGFVWLSGLTIAGVVLTLALPVLVGLVVAGAYRHELSLQPVRH